MLIIRVDTVTDQADAPSGPSRCAEAVPEGAPTGLAPAPRMPGPSYLAQAIAQSGTR